MPRKKSSTNNEQPLVIQHRHVISEDKPSTIEEDASSSTHAATRTEITPRTSVDSEKQPDKKAPDVQAEEPAEVKTPKRIEVQSPGSDESSVPETYPDDESADEPEAAGKAAVAATPPEQTQQAPETATEPKAAASQADKIETDDEVASSETTPNVKKAVEDAAKAEEREQELETYIENKQFFVPIDTVARKRSVKVSLGLTILFAFLAVVLIDLMLDSGTILLVQKIPHTHFFSANVQDSK